MYENRVLEYQNIAWFVGQIHAVSREVQAYIWSSHYHLDFVASSERRLCGDSSLHDPDFGYTLVCEGRSKNFCRDFGVCFAIKSKLLSDMSELLHGVPDRLIILRLQFLPGSSTTVISMFSPTRASSEADIDRYYSDLR